MAAGVAHFYTSYAFPDTQKPRYYAGGGMMSAACLICAGMAIFIKYYLKTQNQKMELEENERGIVGTAVRGSRAGHGGEAVVRFRYVH